MLPEFKLHQRYPTRASYPKWQKLWKLCLGMSTLLALLATPVKTNDALATRRSSVTRRRLHWRYTDFEHLKWCKIAHMGMKPRHIDWLNGLLVLKTITMPIMTCHWAHHACILVLRGGWSLAEATMVKLKCYLETWPLPVWLNATFQITAKFSIYSDLTYLFTGWLIAEFFNQTAAMELQHVHEALVSGRWITKCLPNCSTIDKEERNTM